MPDDETVAPERDEATSIADTFHRHGAPDPSQWDEAPALSSRPNDTPLRGVDKPAVPNTTMGDRAKARQASAKKVDKDADEVEDKAVKPAAATKKAAARKRG